MFEILVQEMKLRNFSPRTIDAYLYYNKMFLDYVKISPREVSSDKIREFLLHLQEKYYSTSSINLAHNALNFYYGNLLHKRTKNISFMKRENTIKDILSKEEIRLLLENTSNPKHKLMVGMLYATGIRVSELVKLKPERIDWERKMVLVKSGKGRKDRYTILSDKIMIEIKTYIDSYPPSNYIFSDNGPLSVRTVQIILKEAARKAGIKKSVHPHLLRHSFATHLMESGAKMEHIQQLLGHTDIRTTQQYARVTNKHLLGIRSPHEDL